jgi:hypothetical protein
MTTQSLLSGKVHNICVQDGHTSGAQCEEHSNVPQHSWNYASCIIPMQPNHKHNISIQISHSVYEKICSKKP